MASSRDVGAAPLHACPHLGSWRDGVRRGSILRLAPGMTGSVPVLAIGHKRALKACAQRVNDGLLVASTPRVIGVMNMRHS